MARLSMAVGLAVLLTVLSAPGMAVTSRPAVKQSVHPVNEVIPAGTGSSVSLRAINAPITRMQLVQALLANPLTQQALAQEATRLCGTAAQIAALGTMPLPITRPPELAGAADAAEYDKIEWKAGVDFTPFKVPTYGAAQWRVGSYFLSRVILKSWVPDAVTFVNMDQQCEVAVGDLNLELPTGPALYAIVIRLTDGNGFARASWLDPDDKGMPTLRAELYSLDQPTLFTTVRIPLTLLPDGNGFAGVFSAKPAFTTEGAEYGMRRINAKLRMVACPGSAEPIHSMNELLFSGVTITRL